MANFQNPYPMTRGGIMKIFCEKSEFHPSVSPLPTRFYVQMKTFVRNRLTDAGIFWISYLLGLIAMGAFIRSTFF